MSQQTEKLFHLVTAKHTKYLKRIWRAIKNFWPLLLLTQIPLIIIFAITFGLTSPAPTSSTTKNFEVMQNDKINNLEIHIKNLTEKILTIQNQYSKILVELKSEKSLQKYENTTTNSNQLKRQILDTIDRIGEKIRLNEPFAGLLASISNECANFSGYQNLHKYSTKLPLTFLQLKKTFDEIYKNYTPPKQESKFPSWLERIASFFRGKIKIERLNQVKTNPLLPVLEALEIHDLKLAMSLAKNIKIPTIGLWADLVQERILLESEYSLFAEKVRDWAEHLVTDTGQIQSENLKQENNL